MKPILFVLGWISFVIGIIGAFLPILPTTPFLILTAFLFSKSSPRFHKWIMELPIAGNGIRDWQNNRVINMKAKVLCASMITFSLVMIGTHENIRLFVKIPVAIILVSVMTFVLTRDSRRKS